VGIRFWPQLWPRLQQPVASCLASTEASRGSVQGKACTEDDAIVGSIAWHLRSHAATPAFASALQRWPCDPANASPVNSAAAGARPDCRRSLTPERRGSNLRPVHTLEFVANLVYKVSQSVTPVSGHPILALTVKPYLTADVFSLCMIQLSTSWQTWSKMEVYSTNPTCLL